MFKAMKQFFCNHNESEEISITFIRCARERNEFGVVTNYYYYAKTIYCPDCGKYFVEEEREEI